MQFLLAAALLEQILFCNKITIQNIAQNFTNDVKSKEDREIFQIMISPPQSPDLLPIELAWNEMNSKVSSKLLKNKQRVVLHIYTLLGNYFH